MVREETGTESIFGQGSYMNPNDTRQYLYRLTPVTAIDKNVKVSNMYFLLVDTVEMLSNLTCNFFDNYCKVFTISSNVVSQEIVVVKSVCHK